MYGEHKAALTALSTRLNLPLVGRKILEYPSECGLNEDSYEDYGHITPAGAQIFTRFLADRIRDEKLLP